MTSRDAYLRRTYKITEPEYDSMGQAQGWLCYICREENPIRGDGSRELLAVDHNHATGEVRALLCQRCNRLLGQAGDAQELLIRCLEYLRYFDGSQTAYTENNAESKARLQAERDATFEQSLLELSADSSGTVPEEEILPAGFASDARSLADKLTPCELD